MKPKNKVNKMKWGKLVSFWELFIFLFCLLLSLSLLLFYFKGMGFSLMRQGIKSMRKKNYTQAQKYFNQALAKKTFEPWSYLNLALSHDLLNAPDKAIKNYDIVSSSLVKQSNTAVFFSYFNKGELNGRLNQIENALKNYQQALNFRYKEKEIKKNIELLLKSQKEKQQNQKDKKENQNKNQKKQQENQKDQQEQSEKNKNKPSGDSKNQAQNSANEPSKGQNTKDSKNLSEKEQKAILEEVEKQENKVRSKFYKGKKIFGDKTKQDW